MRVALLPESHGKRLRGSRLAAPAAREAYRSPDGSCRCGTGSGGTLEPTFRLSSAFANSSGVEIVASSMAVMMSPPRRNSWPPSVTSSSPPLSFAF